MSKAADMAKTSAKGGFHLLWGLIISTIISSVGTIFIGRLLGSDLYGLYGIVLNVPALIAVFRDWGVHSAMVRYTAQYRSEGRLSEVRSVFMAGIVFELILGIILTIISYLFSNFIATDIYNRPEIAPLISIASLTILANGFVSVATAAFTGMDKMEFNSIMMIIQSVFKTFLVIALVLLGLGTSGAIIGYTISILVAGIIGLLLTLKMYRTLPKPFNLKLEIKEYTKEILRYSLPLSLSTIISSFLSLFYVNLLPTFTSDNSLIGNYNIAVSFVVLITFFASPITTMLFPAFSKLDYQKDHDTLQNVFQFSVKYASLMVIPVATLVMCLSKPAVSTLFDNTYDSAHIFLALLSIIYLFTAFGSLSISNLLNGQGQTKLYLKTTILSAAIGFPMGYLLIMQFGVFGLIFTSTFCGVPSLIIMLHWIKKHYNLTVDWSSSARILTASAITATLTYLVVSSLNYASWITLTIGVVTFVLILIPSILLTKSITRFDIVNLRQMIMGLGPISKILSYILDILQKIIILLKL